MPEALPRRYGLYEPPQHVYAATGRAHFLAFLDEHARGIGTVWHPQAPVATVNLCFPERIGGSPRGFLSGTLEIEIDTEALAFGAVAERENGLAHVSTGDWSSQEDAFQLAGPPPAGIAQLAPQFHAPASSYTYPSVWPFETPRQGW